MIIEVCLVLKIILNEQMQFSLEQMSVAPCKATKEPISDAQDNDLTAQSKRKLTANTSSNNSKSDSTSIYGSTSQDMLQSFHLRDQNLKQIDVIQPQPLTKLAKSLSFGFDPFFNKGFFAPFERRPKPITLVAFRKNGILPGSKVKISESKSGEVAELQSPYNDISTFWLEESDKL